MNRKRNLAPVHPGEILREEFLQPMALSINALARALRVPPSQVSGIVNEKRGVSALMALRLGCGLSWKCCRARVDPCLAGTVGESLGMDIVWLE